MKAQPELTRVTVTILQDDGACNPRDEFDNLSTFYSPRCAQYIGGGKHDVTVYDPEDEARIMARMGCICIGFMQAAGWSYAIITREQIKSEYLDNGYTVRKAYKAARSCAQGEIDEWLAYCNGEVYGYEIKDLDGEVLDSCWGFYGRDYCEEEAESIARIYEQGILNEENAVTLRLDTLCTVSA